MRRHISRGLATNLGTSAQSKPVCFLLGTRFGGRNWSVRVTLQEVVRKNGEVRPTGRRVSTQVGHEAYTQLLQLRGAKAWGVVGGSAWQLV